MVRNTRRAKNKKIKRVKKGGKIKTGNMTSKKKEMRKATPETEQSEKKSVDPIPSEFHSVTPYLVVSRGKEAIEFYKNAFGAQELEKQLMPDGKLFHGRIKIGNSIVMLSDEFPGSDLKAPTSLGSSTVTLHIYSDDVDNLWRRALSAGARIVMPLDNQFWGERYGQLMDPFGHRWSLSMRIPMSMEEMEAKRKAAMSMFQRGEHPGREREAVGVA